ncbi:putative proteasome subunit beta type [Cardiosporidium cionae]|uniref:proteasome endopeptidase complex n=1 Tax=Cardiosporidium cionae TaxID=476202 RepID=A0ABQ7JB01_9APIC|nr:putative proteasome subunit beta type [Cardiosporidium cionae]|eukprot:KAF8821181.1 putative proteasome subunit beta type [Cardiosporidium cionae]
MECVNLDALPCSEKERCLPSDLRISSSPVSTYMNMPLSEFIVAPIQRPGRFCAEVKEGKLAPRLMDFSKGTTTLAFIFQGGVIFAVDSRASQGSFLASSTVLKVLPVTDTIMGTLAGCAADCIFWLQHLAKICHLRELQEKEPVSVAAATNLLANIFFQYKGYGLATAIIIGGYDYRGPQLYLLDSEAKRIKGNCFSCGSGSTYAYGILDSEYRFCDFNLEIELQFNGDRMHVNIFYPLLPSRECSSRQYVMLCLSNGPTNARLHISFCCYSDLTVEEAVELGCKAIYHATHRDAGSGNTVTVYHVFEGGHKCLVDAKDVNELHKENCKRKGQPLDQL